MEEKGIQMKKKLKKSKGNSAKTSEKLSIFHSIQFIITKLHLIYLVSFMSMLQKEEKKHLFLA